MKRKNPNCDIPFYKYFDVENKRGKNDIGIKVANNDLICCDCKSKIKKGETYLYLIKYGGNKILCLDCRKKRIENIK